FSVYVARAAVERLLEHADAPEIVRSEVAQLPYAKARGRFVTLPPPNAIVARSVLVREAGIDDGDHRAGGHGNFLERSRARIEKQRRAPVPETAHHLIHDADRRTHEFGF